MQDSGLNKGSAGTRHIGWFGCKSMYPFNTILGTQFFDFIFFPCNFSHFKFQFQIHQGLFFDSFFFQWFPKAVMYWSSIRSLRSRTSPMINLFTSQASTWRGGRVKPVEHFFQTSEFTGYWLASQGADCKFMQFQHVRYSNHHLLHISSFSCCCSCCCLWLVWLVWLVFLHWISPRKPTQAITDENLGYRFYALWAQCDRCWLEERSVENSASKKKNKTGLHSRRFINPTISRPRKEIASRALWSKIFVGQVQGKGGGQLGNWRTEVVPCFEASTQEEAKEKRLLVETLRLTVEVDEETLKTLATAELNLVPGFG